MPLATRTDLVITESVLRRFWAKVEKRGPNECWLWTGSADESGYGRMGIAGDSAWLAHRVAWVIHNGPIPDGQNVLHNCPEGDNPGCVNPAHHFLGTLTDNNRDMHRKGRGNPQGTFTRTQCRKGHVLTQSDLRAGRPRANGEPGWKCRVCENTAKRARRRRKRESV